MAHPTRTGDLVAFSYPPYQFDAATPGTLVAPSAFFGQHGYVPDVKDLAANVNMRATFLAGGKGIAKGTVTARTIDLAPTLSFILGIPEPQMSQGRVLLDVVKGSSSYKPISIVGLTDFHGQLDQTTLTPSTTASTSRSAARPTWRRCSTRSSRTCPARASCSPRATTSAPRRPTPGLLEDMPTIDVENAWGLDATSLGNHEFDYGIDRLKAHIARADFPFLATNVVETATGEIPDWLDGASKVFTVNGIKVGVIGAELKETPRARLRRRHRRPHVPRRGPARSRPSPSGSGAGASRSRSS